MILPAEVEAILKLIEDALSRLSPDDHPGLRGHLLAARTQIEAVHRLAK